MTPSLAVLAVVGRVAVRNLIASRVKTLIVGGIVALGAFLVVVGSSLLDGVDNAMRRSITGSVAGDIQVYSSESTDALEVLGSMTFDSLDIAPISDFARVREVISAVPNVATVVPMGIDSAIVTSGNAVDQALSELRSTLSQAARGSATAQASVEAQKSHVRQIVVAVARDLEKMRQVDSEGALGPGERRDLSRAQSSGFWREFDEDPFANLEFLEDRVAPLATDADMLPLRYVGTDPEAFRRAFDRMTTVDGEAIPRGQRGFLFSKYVYEEQVKLKAARGLDKIKRARDLHGQTISDNADLERLVQENRAGVREIVLQLDEIETDKARRGLQRELGTSESDITRLLAAFFVTDDGNFDSRYRFFYEQLAPLLQLYRVAIGDELTIKALSRTGYVRSVSLKVYGTFAFKGMENSPQAGSLNMMDLVSFRDLYGFMTPERARELAAMHAASGAVEAGRDEIEATLFGVDSLGRVEEEDVSGRAQGPSPLDVLAHLERERGAVEDDGGYDPAELRRGAFLNAAVLLEDESRTSETMAEIERAVGRANLPLNVVTWQTAAGMLGQFAALMRAVLYGTVFIIFLVALIVINNALVMATLERVRELGTLRAIGAQRHFVLGMLLAESTATGLAAGTFGTVLGACLLGVLHFNGIPAGSDVLSFAFSGPRLFPQVAAGPLVGALGVVLAVAMVSSLYPAWLAMRVSPREAMQTEEA